MVSDEELKEGLRRIAGTFAPDASVLALVKAVNEEDCTCVLVDDDGQEFYDVRLRPVTGSNKGFLQIPKAGSFVLAVRVEDSDEYMVLACDEIEKIKIIVGKEDIYRLITDLFAAIM